MTVATQPFSLFENLHPVEVRQMQFVGISRMIKPRTHFTTLEQRYYAMLKSLQVFYVPQYQIGSRYFDAYLPDYNLLIEFDGSFWHKQSLEECKYECQRKNFQVDKLKNRIAEENGHRILRIREDEPITADEMRRILKEAKQWD